MQVRRCVPVLGAVALMVSMVGAVAPAHADMASAAGSDCRSDQVGDSATTDDGAVVRCLATEQGGFSWMADTGATGTIADLEQQGYTVRIDRVGSGPLSACKVTDVRNPVTTTRTDNDRPDLPEVLVINKSVNVSLDCSS